MSTTTTGGIDAELTVGELVEASPTALMQLLEYQSGTSGLCVIAGDDTLGALSERFGVSEQTLLENLTIDSN